MNAEPENNFLTTSQALGLPLENRPRPLAADTQVDEFSFVYSRGARAGKRRTVTLHDKVEQEGRKDLRLTCCETNKAGIVKPVKIWPSLTAEVSYHKEASVESNQQSGPCPAAPILQNPLSISLPRANMTRLLGRPR